MQVVGTCRGVGGGSLWRAWKECLIEQFAFLFVYVDFLWLTIGKPLQHGYSCSSTIGGGAVSILVGCPNIV